MMSAIGWIVAVGGPLLVAWVVARIGSEGDPPPSPPAANKGERRVPAVPVQRPRDLIPPP